jgi:hypothetical protein
LGVENLKRGVVVDVLWEKQSKNYTEHWMSD